MVEGGKALQVYCEARNKEGQRTKKFPISHFVVFRAEVTYETWAPFPPQPPHLIRHECGNGQFEPAH